MLGWRKLSAWGLVFIFVVAATFFAKNAIPAENAELLKWITAFFFGANAIEHFAGKFKVNVSPK